MAECIALKARSYSGAYMHQCSKSSQEGADLCYAHQRVDHILTVAATCRSCDRSFQQHTGRFGTSRRCPTGWNPPYCGPEEKEEPEEILPRGRSALLARIKDLLTRTGVEDAEHLIRELEKRCIRDCDRCQKPRCWMNDNTISPFCEDHTQEMRDTLRACRQCGGVKQHTSSCAAYHGF